MDVTHIAVVGVEDRLTESLQKALSQLGYEVCQNSSSPEEALAYLRGNHIRIDLVLMDVKLMGQLNGIEAASKISKQFDKPVIYISTFSDANLLERSRLTSPDGYIFDLCNPTEIHTVIRVAFEKKRREQVLLSRLHWLNSTIDGITCAIVTVDTAGFIQNANQAFEQLSGHSRVRLKHRPLCDVISLDETGNKLEISKVQSVAVRLNSNGEHASQDRRSSSCKEDAVRVYLHSLPIENDHGPSIGSVLFFNINPSAGSSPSKEMPAAFPERIGPSRAEWLGVHAGSSIENMADHPPDTGPHKPSCWELSSGDKIIGSSTALRNVMTLVQQIARTDCNVFITGETGTGKELVARALHCFSNRSQENFVPLDCVAMPANLLESELFGFEKGAFTGAYGRKSGLLEFAHKGTIFLDEISELAPDLQPKLLRVLQERKFRRIGGTNFIPLNARVVSATNRNPLDAIAKNHLRQDLLYRLNVIPIQIPPLRERREDIRSLVAYFLKLLAEKSRMEPKTLTNAAMETLSRYDWPGNVRQLQNLVERVVILSRNNIVHESDLPEHIKLDSVTAPEYDSYRVAKEKRLEHFEKEYFAELLIKSNMNIARAAKLAGISDKTIYRALKKYPDLLTQ